MIENKEKLKKGYTTGTHATAVFKAILLSCIMAEDKSEAFELNTPLANGSSANIQIEYCIKKDHLFECATIKTDNDDLDVTKGCRIICYLSEDKALIERYLNPLEHQERTITVNNVKINLYAGKGVGVVSKKGLKVPIGFPAINPAPFKQFILVAEKVFKNIDSKMNIYCCISIENGETLALETANPKIGILAGLSILGTSGIVKPISIRAYLETIETELSVAEANNSPIIIFTLGNSSLNFAKKHFNVPPEAIIEIGNFIFDSMKLLKNKAFIEIYFVSNLGKMVKLAQGYKNTHNQYGKIKFDVLREWIIEKLPHLNEDIQALDLNTTTALTEFLSEVDETENYVDIYYKTVNDKAVNVLAQWHQEIMAGGKFQLQSIHSICIKDEEHWQSTINLTNYLESN